MRVGIAVGLAVGFDVGLAVGFAVIGRVRCWRQGAGPLDRTRNCFFGRGFSELPGPVSLFCYGDGVWLGFWVDGTMVLYLGNRRGSLVGTWKWPKKPYCVRIFRLSPPKKGRRMSLHKTLNVNETAVAAQTTAAPPPPLIPAGRSYLSAHTTATISVFLPLFWGLDRAHRWCWHCARTSWR